MLWGANCAVRVIARSSVEGWRWCYLCCDDEHRQANVMTELWELELAVKSEGVSAPLTSGLEAP